MVVEVVVAAERQRLAGSVRCSPANCAANPWPMRTACSAIDASTWPSPSRLLAMSAVVGITAGTTCWFTVGRIIRDSRQLMTRRWTLQRSHHLRTLSGFWKGWNCLCWVLRLRVLFTTLLLRLHTCLVLWEKERSLKANCTQNFTLKTLFPYTLPKKKAKCKI